MFPFVLFSLFFSLRLSWGCISSQSVLKFVGAMHFEAPNHTGSFEGPSHSDLLLHTPPSNASFFSSKSEAPQDNTVGLYMLAHWGPFLSPALSPWADFHSTMKRDIWYYTRRFNIASPTPLLTIKSSLNLK